MQTGWILRDGAVVCAAERTTSLTERTRGLLGHRSYDGAMLLEHTRGIHTVFMRFAIDVAFLSGDGEVLAVAHVRPFRMALPHRRGRKVLEAAAGSFERWSVHVGDRLEFRESS
jgi:uncharacterized membrane protein (UPF0127 family)